MTYFDVKNQGLNSAIGSLDSYRSEIDHIWSEVASIQNNLHMETAASAGIRRRLESAKNSIENNSKGMKNLSNGLESCVKWYVETETRLTGGEVSEGNIGNVTETSDWTKSEWVKTAVDVVAEAGVIGKTAKAVWNVVTGNGTAASWAKGIKGAYGVATKVGENIIKAKKGTDVDWKGVITGFTKNSSLQKIARSSLSAGEKLKHGFRSEVVGTLRNFKSPGKCAKEVGGIALSGIVNLFGNMDEYGGDWKNHGGRIIAETVTETAVDWGTGLLIGAGVAAGFAAAGIAAPAVVVGGAAVLVTAGIDCLWKHTIGNGKGLTESVSDAILDGGKAAINAGKKAVSAVSKKVSAGWKSVTKGFSKLFG